VDVFPHFAHTGQSVAAKLVHWCSTDTLMWCTYGSAKPNCYGDSQRMRRQVSTQLRRWKRLERFSVFWHGRSKRSPARVSTPDIIRLKQPPLTKFVERFVPGSLGDAFSGWDHSRRLGFVHG
jgi:hypothetical protein